MKNNHLNRRNFLKTMGLTVAAISIPQYHFCTKSDTQKPNIIFILADDLGYGDLGCYGQTKIKTPNLDQMAAEGMRFTQHYAGSTVCAPSRCSLLTGLHTGHTFIRGNREIEGYQLAIPAGTQTIATLLKQAGYNTGLVGKWGLGGPDTTGHPNKQGFDYFYGYLGQVQAHFYYPPFLWENDNKIELPGNTDSKKETFSHDLLSEKALEFIEKNKNDQFFLYLAYTIPHAELAAPEDSINDYKDQFDETPYIGRHYGSQPTPRAAYAAMVSRMDRDVGKILNLLKQLGVDNNSIVCFTSDNGPHSEGGNDPAIFNSSGPMRGIKRDLYEGGIRVPFIVRWPGKIKAGAVSDHVSAFWDLLPTCCEISGFDPPANVDGISFYPELLGKKQDRHPYLYWEFHERDGKLAVRMGDWKAVKLNIKTEPDRAVELYNLKEDIHEDRDVAGEHPDIVKKIKKIIEQARTKSEQFPFYEKEKNGTRI